MALALDGSTPAAVTGLVSGATNTQTTASFTPPSGSILIVIFETNEGNSGTNSGYAVTDNRVSHLTYTHLTQQGLNTNDVAVNIWWAPVVTSAAMTVSASNASSTTLSSAAMLRVLVFTGADTTGPIGATGGGRGRTTNLSTTAAQYVSTRNLSWGWVAYADWTQSGVPTVPAGETVDSSFNSVGQDSYAVIKNNATTTTSGTTVTLTTSTPTTALQLSWIYFEVLPAVSGARGLFLPSLLSGLGAGGSFFRNPLG